MQYKGIKANFRLMIFFLKILIYLQRIYKSFGHINISQAYKLI